MTPEQVRGIFKTCTSEEQVCAEVAIESQRELAQAVGEERERCAKYLEDAVAEHRRMELEASQERLALTTNFPEAPPSETQTTNSEFKVERKHPCDSWCENYGCTSILRFAEEIRRSGEGRAGA